MERDFGRFLRIGTLDGIPPLGTARSTFVFLPVDDRVIVQDFRLIREFLNLIRVDFVTFGALAPL